MKKIVTEILNKLFKVLVKKPCPLHEPFFDRSEIDYLKKNIKKKSVSTYGKETDDFERKLKEFTKAKYAHAIINGTSALHLSLYIAGVDDNTEVLIPGLNYIASTNATIYLKGTPHFIDIEEKTLGPDFEKLDLYLKKNTFVKNNKCVNKKTKKIIKILVVTHVFGHPCQIEKAIKICKKYKIDLIEDAAEGLGSFYNQKHVGNFGLMGILSFNGNKIITTGAGGAILTNSKKISEKIKHISLNSRKTLNWNYEYSELGFNYKMPSLNASLGIAQIKKLKNFIKLKRKLYKKYYLNFKNFNSLRLFKEPKNCKSNYWLNTIILNKPNKKLVKLIVEKTNSIGIGTRPVWKILSKNKYLNSYPSMKLEKCLDLEKRLINLPSSPGLIKLK